MKKYIFTLFLINSFLFSQAQVKFLVANASGNKSDTVSVAVTTTGFTNVLATQYSVNYDSSILAIVDLTPSASYVVDYATHVGSATVKNGEITFSWSSPDPQGKGITLANGSLLFTMRFKLIGKECDSSFVKVTGKPLQIEILDGNFDNLNLTTTDGKVKINGTGCVITNPPSGDLEIIAAQDVTPQGVVKCIKVTAKGLKKLTTGQFTMHWDKSIAKFDGINSGAMTLIYQQNYAPLSDSSGVRIIWDSGIDSLTVPDGTTLFEVCLNPVGAPGTSTNIDFDGTPTPIEFYDTNGGPIPVKFTSGKLSITAAPAQTLKLYVRDTTVQQCGEFCFPIRVDNFKCIDNFQFTILFDTTKLKFKRLKDINLPGFGPANYFIKGDSIRVQWDAQTGSQTRTNGDYLFLLCFEGLYCPFTTKLRFADLSNNAPIEFSDCNFNNFTVVKGEPDLDVICCQPPTTVVITLPASANAVKCYFDCNGSIKGTDTTGGKGPFTFEWFQWFDPTTFLSVSTVLEPTDLCAGVYFLRVTDLGNANAVVTSDTIRVKTPRPVSIHAVITHVQTVNDGKIDVTIDSGGTPPFKHVWRRISSPGNPPPKVGSTEDLMNIPGATYEDSITDANGCIFVDTFIVNPAPIRFFSSTVINNACNGECKGSIQLDIAGGRTPYSYKWSNDSTKNPLNGLCAGTYSVTVSDNSTPPNTINSTFTITEPAKIAVKILSITKSSGNDGAVKLDTVTGGTKPYTYVWTNSTGVVISSNKDISGLAPGSYKICVSDSAGCTQCLDVIVDPSNSNPPVLTVVLNIDPYVGGQAISCRGKCDGKIVVTVTSSDPRLPYTYKWSHNSNLPSNTSIATNLCPGQYTVTVTDAAGNTKVSNTITIQDAPTITLSARRVDCATNDASADGEYEAITNGAVLPISYRWCNGAINKTATDLNAGACSIMITDANNCTISETFLVCTATATPGECYQGRRAISPNGDGFNDVFEIACVLDFDNFLKIYDRWGNLVFSATNYTNDWDGLNKDGSELTEGTYLWILKVDEPGKEDAYYKGTVTIVR